MSNHRGPKDKMKTNICNNKDEQGRVLTYTVWDEHTLKELGEFNSLREARAFAKEASIQ